MEWPTFRNRIPSIALGIQLGFDAFMGILGVKGCTRSWEAGERDQ